MRLISQFFTEYIRVMPRIRFLSQMCQSPTAEGTRGGGPIPAIRSRSAAGIVRFRPHALRSPEKSVRLKKKLAIKAVPYL